MIRLVGPGGAGKTSTGTLVADRLGVSFLDLDQAFARRAGDITSYIQRQGYKAYARENMTTYLSAVRGPDPPSVVALSSGFMTYPEDVPQTTWRRARTSSEAPRHSYSYLPLIWKRAWPRSSVVR